RKSFGSLERAHHPQAPRRQALLEGDACGLLIRDRHWPAVEELDDAKRLAVAGSTVPVRGFPGGADQKRPAMRGRPEARLDRLLARRDHLGPGIVQAECFHDFPPSIRGAATGSGESSTRMRSLSLGTLRAASIAWLKMTRPRVSARSSMSRSIA